MDRSRVPTSGVIREKKLPFSKNTFPISEDNRNLQLERLPSQERDTQKTKIRQSMVKLPWHQG